MPEKNGVRVMSRSGAVPPPARVVVVVDTSVTKNSSVPTLITAFWLFSVEMRGLDSTRTSPWVSSNCRMPSKSPTLSAALNTPPMPWAPASSAPARATPKRLLRSRPRSLQRMPAWNSSVRLTSRILVSRITWRCRLRCALSRKSATLCWSALEARTTSRPACGLTTTLLPSSAPMIIATTACTSFQKSALLLVSRWLALTVLAVLLVVVPAAPAPMLSLVVTWPELTRVSLMPWRCTFR